MPRILITGASGFIGGYLVEKALSLQLEVTAAIRPGSDRSRLGDPRIQLLELPLGRPDELMKILSDTERFDWIIHNAGVTKALQQQGYHDGNVGNTQRFVQALQAADRVPDKFLFVSSLAALGAAPADCPAIHARQKPRPLTFYGTSKYEAEQYLDGLQAYFPWVVVQPTAVYGPWERDILTFIKMMGKGLEMTIGRKPQRLSFVHAEDVAGAIFKILESTGVAHHKFIISDGKSYRTEDLGAAVRQALGNRKTLKIRLPLALVRQVAAAAETVGKWQNKPVPLNRDKIAELAAENWHCDAAPLLETIQYQPKYDLYTGMADTVKWYRQHGWL